MTTNPKADPIQAIVDSIAEGSTQALYLVTGDRVLTEAGAGRIADALAKKTESEIESYVRPVSLDRILADLKTYSLFSPAKIVVVVESSVLADETTAAALVDEVLEVLPLGSIEPEQPSQRELIAASRLLHVLRLFRIDPFSGAAEDSISDLPDAALKGAKGSGRKRARTSRQIEEAREQLSALLGVARLTDLQGRVETDVGELLEIVERGLPTGHSLVLAESNVAVEHPLSAALEDHGSLIVLGGVEAGKRDGWEGLERLAAALEKETGTSIAPRALKELATRTLQVARNRGRATSHSVSSDSSSRFAAEYRKLASLAGGNSIDLGLVESSVEDRGEEDIWKTLDAIGAGRASEALKRVERLMASNEDAISARLSLFSVVASFCRQLTALAGVINLAGIDRRATSYNVFKTKIAPRLQADLPGGLRSPLAGLHPFRLSRAYGVACKMSPATLANLPARVLEVEMQIKGDSGLPDAALSSLICDLSTSVANPR